MASYGTRKIKGNDMLFTWLIVGPVVAIGGAAWVFAKFLVWFVPELVKAINNARAGRGFFYMEPTKPVVVPEEKPYYGHNGYKLGKAAASIYAKLRNVVKGK